jgi:uncharacterized protein (TIGR03000 family)
MRRGPCILAGLLVAGVLACWSAEVQAQVTPDVPDVPEVGDLPKPVPPDPPANPYYDWDPNYYRYNSLFLYGGYGGYGGGGYGGYGGYGYGMMGMLGLYNGYNNFGNGLNRPGYHLDYAPLANYWAEMASRKPPIYDSNPYSGGSYGSGQGGSNKYKKDGPVSLPEDRALINVLVPSSNAQLWLDGNEVKGDGLSRRLLTPELNPGVNYTMRVSAQWLNKGKLIQRTQAVRVGRGQTVEVNFAAETKNLYQNER